MCIEWLFEYMEYMKNMEVLLSHCDDSCVSTYDESGLVFQGKGLNSAFFAKMTHISESHVSISLCVFRKETNRGRV